MYLCNEGSKSGHTYWMLSPIKEAVSSTGMSSLSRVLGKKRGEDFRMEEGIVLCLYFFCHSHMWLTSKTGSWYYELDNDDGGGDDGDEND